MEINNLPGKEFKVMVIKMLTDFERRMDEHSENVNKIENIRKCQAEVYNGTEKYTRVFQQQNG